MQEGELALPDEILERIFAHLFELGPDRRSVAQTCRRFYRIIASLDQRQTRHFEKRLALGVLHEIKGAKLKLRQSPSARCQHASCMMNGKLYVFGGFNDSRGETAFADLWRYEPQRNEWRRVMCTTTPMPKGGALMLPFEAANVLVLIGGILPRHIHNAPRVVPPMKQLIDVSVLNVTVNGKQNWNNLVVPNRPLSRFNFTGCIMQRAKCIIIDGGSITVAPSDDDDGFDQSNAHSDPQRQTFVLDMDKNACDSWLWSTCVRVGGFAMPQNRALHQMLALSDDQFLITSVTGRTEFITGHMSITPANIELGQRHRQFMLMLTKLKLDIAHLPAYLHGARFATINNVVYWLSPVSMGKPSPSGSALSLYRCRIEHDQVTFLPPSPPIRIADSSQHVACLFGYALGRAASGLLVFGGATDTTNGNVWRNWANIREPHPSNDMFFLQI